MKRTVWRTGPVARCAALCALAVALAGCAERFRNHGYVPSAEELAQVRPGVDTRDSVIEAIGSPSSTSVLGDSGIYYVSTRMRYYGPKAPEVVARELVAISFDQAGVVRNIERYGLADGRVVPLQRRVTDSAIQDKTFIRQLLGNLGNFNPATALPTSE